MLMFASFCTASCNHDKLSRCVLGTCRIDVAPPFKTNLYRCVDFVNCFMLLLLLCVPVPTFSLHESPPLRFPPWESPQAQGRYCCVFCLGGRLRRYKCPAPARGAQRQDLLIPQNEHW